MEESVKPAAWIVESKAGVWMTEKEEVMQKQKSKAGVIITPYFKQSKEAQDV